MIGRRQGLRRELKGAVAIGAGLDPYSYGRIVKFAARTSGRLPFEQSVVREQPNPSELRFIPQSPEGVLQASQQRRPVGLAQRDRDDAAMPVVQPRDGVEEIPIGGHEHRPEFLRLGEKQIVGPAGREVLQRAAALVPRGDQQVRRRPRKVLVEEEPHGSASGHTHLELCQPSCEGQAGLDVSLG